MSNTLEVIRFEVMRNLKKPSFWIAAVLIPIGFAIYVAVASLVGHNASEAFESGTDTTDLKLGIYDEAEYLKETKFINAKNQEQTLAKYESKEQGITDIKEKKIDVFYCIDKDFANTQKVEIYTKPTDPSLVDNYTNPIRLLLSNTAISKVDAIDVAVITNKVSYDAITFDNTDDHVIDMNEKVQQIIGPVLALACFYILMVVLGNRLTAAMVEEKENRISELVLTSIKPNNFIVGKIISLMIVGIIQLLIIVIPVLLLYSIGQNANIFPEWLKLSFDFVSIVQYMALLIASYFLFTAMSVTIGVISPTARDANSYSSVIIIMVIMPMFFLSTFMPAAMNTMTYILSYFPPSAPIALMLRAIFGNLPTWEFWLGFADIAIAGILIAKLATHIFCKNAIEYTSKVDFKKLFNKPRKTWKK